MTNRKMNFSRRKQILLNTHKEFDGSASGSRAVNSQDGLNTQVVPVNSQAIPNNLVIEALIQQVCIYMEKDAKKRSSLYNAICKILNANKFLSLNFTLGELWPLKEQFRNALSSFFRQVHEEVSCQGLGTYSSLSIRSVFDSTKIDYVTFSNSNRYQQSFEQLETIARGGFGVVCKFVIRGMKLAHENSSDQARNKIDGIVYAVKKIKFKYTDDTEFAKILREVRSFALLRHQNIVNYNNSWLETNIVTGPAVYTKSSDDSESSSSDDEQQTNNFSNAGSHESHSVSPVHSFPSKVVQNGDGNSNMQNNDLNAILVDYRDAPVNTEKTSLVINSKRHTLHQKIVIEKKYENIKVQTSGHNIKLLSDGQFSSLQTYSALSEESSSSDEQIIFASGSEEISESKCQCVEIDESGDHNQPRRRRHSSGATCTIENKNSEAGSSKKDVSRSYDRGNSLDSSLMNCMELLPRKPETKWDISNLDVMAVLYIQMELCDESLRDWLDERAANTPPSSDEHTSVAKALNMLFQIVQGVEHIHSKSIIHRDLKIGKAGTELLCDAGKLVVLPKNIFLCHGDLIKIGDFGLATLCTETQDTEFCHPRCFCSHSQVIGTAPYAAPEQKEGHLYDNKVDIYSLGIILIELLHCCKTRMEFFRTIDKILEGSIPIEFIDIWPKEIVNLIRKLTSHNHQERPEAKEVLSDLKKFKANQPLEIKNIQKDITQKEHEAAEISLLKSQIDELKRQLSEKDETIKELQLKLLYSSNCDSFL